MKTIASFTVNHDKLEKGMYISRIDGDVVTYDIRMKKPNGGDYLSNGELHTFEHLFATYARNGSLADQVLYVGPMGCRTGFYLLLRDTVSPQDAIRLVQESFAFIAEFEGEIPGSKRWECGNYLEHDLDGAKKVAKDMLSVLENWSKERLHYESAPVIGIIGAMDSEITTLSGALQEKEVVQISNLVFLKGVLSGKKVVVVKSGIGKVNAARCTQLLIDCFAPDCIINSGIAGALDPELTAGDIVIGTGLIQHDFDVSGSGYARGYLYFGDPNEPSIFQADPFLIAQLEETIHRSFPQKKLKKGRIATGDQFISNAEVRQGVWNEFGAFAVEMEGAAIAQTAMYNNIPFAVLRVISDQADGNAAQSFDVFEKETAKVSSTIIEKLMENDWDSAYKSYEKTAGRQQESISE